MPTSTPTPTPVFSFQEVDFLDIGNATTPNILPLQYVTQLDESPQAKTAERSYVPNKNATVLTTGYQTQFPFSTDEYTDDDVTAFIRDIAEEQKLGVQCPYYKVRLYEPVEGETNTYYARKFTVGFAIDSVTREAGGIKTISGNMNAIGDVVIGTFNTQTKTFTPNA